MKYSATKERNERERPWKRAKPKLSLIPLVYTIAEWYEYRKDNYFKIWGTTNSYAFAQHIFEIAIQNSEKGNNLKIKKGKRQAFKLKGKERIYILKHEGVVVSTDPFYYEILHFTIQINENPNNLKEDVTLLVNYSEGIWAGSHAFSIPQLLNVQVMTQTPIFSTLGVDEDNHIFDSKTNNFEGFSSNNLVYIKSRMNYKSKPILLLIDPIKTIVECLATIPDIEGDEEIINWHITYKEVDYYFYIRPGAEAFLVEIFNSNRILLGFYSKLPSRVLDYFYNYLFTIFPDLLPHQQGIICKYGLNFCTQDGSTPLKDINRIIETNKICKELELRLHNSLLIETDILNIKSRIQNSIIIRPFNLKEYVEDEGYMLELGKLIRRSLDGLVEGGSVANLLKIVHIGEEIDPQLLELEIQKENIICGIQPKRLIVGIQEQNKLRRERNILKYKRQLRGMFSAALVTSNLMTDKTNKLRNVPTLKGMNILNKLNECEQKLHKQADYNSPFTYSSKKGDSSRHFFPKSPKSNFGLVSNESSSHKHREVASPGLDGESSRILYEISPDTQRIKSQFSQKRNKSHRRGTLKRGNNTSISLNTFTDIQTEGMLERLSPTLQEMPNSPTTVIDPDVVETYEENTERGCFNPLASDRAHLYSDRSSKPQQSSKLVTEIGTDKECSIRKDSNSNSSPWGGPILRQETVKSKVDSNRSKIIHMRTESGIKDVIMDESEYIHMEEDEENNLEYSQLSHRLDKTADEKLLNLKKIDEVDDEAEGDPMTISPKMSPIVKLWQKAIRKVIFINKFSSLNKEIHTEKFLDEKIHYPLIIILPESKFHVLWSVVMLIALSFTAIYLPIRMAFFDEISKGLLIVEYILDFIFLIDVFVNFLTAYYDDEHKLITDRGRIAKKYLTSWFLIDVLALFPFSSFEGGSEGAAKDINKLLRLLRLSRLYRIIKYLPIFDLLHKNKNFEKMLITMKMNSGIKRLLKSILGFCLFSHLFACFWFYTARFSNFNPETWVIRYGIRDFSVDHQYLISFSWVVTLSMVGYGDLYPYTKAERLVAMIYIVAGITFVSYAIGTLSAILLSSDSKAENLKKRLLVLDELALTLHMDPNLYYKLKQIIRSNHETHFYSDMNYDSLLEELPSSLRSQLITLIYNENKLDVITFFQNQHPNFLNSILPLLKRISVEKDEVIFNDGDMADEMYFILEGRVRFVSSDNYVFRIMPKGQYFGEQEMLKKEDFRGESAIAAEDCKLLVLKRNELLTLMEAYSDVAEQLREESTEREQQNKEFLIQARFANTKIENIMLDRIEAQRASNAYNRNFTTAKSFEFLKVDMGASPSHLTEINETVQDISESDYSSIEEEEEKKRKSSISKKGDEKNIEWEEESEDLECSDTYSSDEESKSSRGIGPRKASTKSIKRRSMHKTGVIFKGKVNKVTENNKRKSLFRPKPVDTGFLPPIKELNKSKPVIPKLNLHSAQEKPNKLSLHPDKEKSNTIQVIKVGTGKGGISATPPTPPTPLTPITPITPSTSNRPETKKRKSRISIARKKKNSLIEENSILSLNRRSSLQLAPPSAFGSAGMLQSKLLAIQDGIPQTMKEHKQFKPVTAPRGSLSGLEMIMELRDEIHSLKENINGYKIEVSPPPKVVVKPPSPEKKSSVPGRRASGRRGSKGGGTDVFSFGKRASILHSMEWQNELGKKKKL